MVEKTVPKLYAVTHQYFRIDDLGYTSTLFFADTKQEALDAYNRLALERTGYPYSWDQRTLEDVHPVKAYYCE